MSKKKQEGKKKVSKKKISETNPTLTELRAYSIFKEEKDSFQSGLLMGPGMGGKELDDPNAVHSNALEFEDDFKGLYGPVGNDSTVTIMHPPFDPQVLEKLVKHNNALSPCIDAMVVNIDGTGFEVIKRTRTDGQDEETDKELSSKEKKDLKALRDFFKEPWPGCSFTKLRKALRQDLETIGYGFLEVIRNPKGQIVFLRHVEAKTIRLLKLDGGRIVKRSIERGGVKLESNVRLRFRRFAQKSGQKVVYFKEFQADLDLDKSTGKWVESNSKKKLAFNAKASELIYFTINKDINSPYGVPRWINQIPSVLGSRKAEENNLSFFNSGGVPPFILLVQGGILAQETKDTLDQGLSSSGSAKQRGLVIEAHSSSGSIDDKNNVKVQVERFGGEKQKDSQFEEYDNKSEIRIRSSFRLPPIFVGRTGEYNFASAFASYMVGEAQIFKPERDEFDELITLKLIPEILGKGADNDTYQFRSLPIVVNDAKEKIMCVKTAADKKAISTKEMVRVLNEITGLEMIPADESDQLPADTLDDDNEGITSDSELTDADTSDPNGPQGIVDNKQ